MIIRSLGFGAFTPGPSAKTKIKFHFIESGAAGI